MRILRLLIIDLSIEVNFNQEKQSALKPVVLAG